MGGEDIQDLQKFIRPYPPEVQNLALWLREWVWELYPSCNELIYDGYSAVAFGWSLTDRLGHTFCSVALMPKYVHFGFFWGSEISDPEKRLLGKGNQYRYIVVNKRANYYQIGFFQKKTAGSRPIKTNQHESRNASLIVCAGDVWRYRTTYCPRHHRALRRFADRPAY
jgi:hypothetical protein